MKQSFNSDLAAQVQCSKGFSYNQHKAAHFAMAGE